MFKPKLPQLPFLTREMLKFGNRAKLELEVVAYATDSGTVLMVGLTRDGVLKYEVTHTGDGSSDVLTFGIPDIPISLTLFTDDLSIERGDYFASVYLKVNGERVFKLCSGYVSKQSGINFPQTHDETELGGGGKFKVVAVTNPAAGDDWYHAVPANEHWILHGITMRLITDANAANRRVHIRIPVNGTDGLLRTWTATDQVASTTRYYYFGAYPAIPDEEQDTRIMGIIPPNLHQLEADTFYSEIENIQAGDAIAFTKIAVEQYFED